MEGVADIDRNPFLDDRLDGRRVDDLCAEVGEFLGGAVGNVPDGSGRRDDLRIGGHHSVDVGPYLDEPRVDADGIEGGGIIRAAAPQGRDPAEGIGGDETRNDEQRGMGTGVHGFADVRVGRFRIDGALDGADDFPGIEPYGRDSEGCELRGDDLRREQFPVALDGVQARIAEFPEEEDAAGDAFERTEQSVDRLADGVAVALRKEFFYDGEVPLLEGGDVILVGLVPEGRFLSGFDEPVRAAAHRRADDDGTVPFQGCGHDVRYGRDGGGVGDRGPAEFHYLHSRGFK